MDQVNTLVEKTRKLSARILCAEGHCEKRRKLKNKNRQSNDLLTLSDDGEPEKMVYSQRGQSLGG